MSVVTPEIRRIEINKLDNGFTIVMEIHNIVNDSDAPSERHYKNLVALTYNEACRLVVDEMPADFEKDP